MLRPTRSCSQEMIRDVEYPGESKSNVVDDNADTNTYQPKQRDEKPKNRVLRAKQEIILGEIYC